MSAPVEEGQAKMAAGSDGGRAVATRAHEALAALLRQMGVDVAVAVHEEEARIVLDVSGADAGLVIGKKGATLDALQYLVAKMIGTAGEGEGGRYLEVDAEGYRGRRKESLVELAMRLGEQAKTTRRIVKMEPMSPHDRRIVHVALADVPGVTTRSEGEGAFRRLLIVPDGATGGSRSSSRE